MATRQRVRTWRPLLALGVLLIVYGTVVAVAVGPDESISIDTHVLPESARGLAVATHPEITAFRDVDMEVSVSAPSGVFLAASHRVDTESLLGGRSHYEISKMFFGDVDGRMLDDGPRARFRQLRPDRLVGWASVSPDVASAVAATSSTTGGTTGEKKLPALPRSASLVVPLGEEPLDVVAFPMSPDEALTLTLGVHAARAFTLHLVLVAAGTVLVVVWWLLRRRTRRRTPTAVAPVVVLGLAATGCAVPSALPVTETVPVRVAMTSDDATQLFADAPQAVHAVEFDSYPMWAVVQVPPRSDRRRARLVILTRSAFEEPWERIGSVELVTAPPPPGNPRSVTSNATHASAVAAGAEIAEFWMLGQRTGTLRIDDASRTARAKLLRLAGAEDATWREENLWVLGGAEKDVRIVPVVGGHLALVTHRLHDGVQGSSANDSPDRRLTSAVMLRTGRRAEVLGSALESPAQRHLQQ